MQPLQLQIADCILQLLSGRYHSGYGTPRSEKVALIAALELTTQGWRIKG